MFLERYNDEYKPLFFKNNHNKQVIVKKIYLFYLIFKDMDNALDMEQKRGRKTK